MSNDKSIETHCPNCGPSVALDEDLCCAGCGAPATLADLADTYRGLEEAKNEYAQGCYDLQKERDEARAELLAARARIEELEKRGIGSLPDKYLTIRNMSKQDRREIYKFALECSAEMLPDTEED